MRSFHCLRILGLPARNSSAASSKKGGGFEQANTVFSTGLTMVPKRFESLISDTGAKSTAKPWLAEATAASRHRQVDSDLLGRRAWVR